MKKRALWKYRQETDLNFADRREIYWKLVRVDFAGFVNPSLKWMLWLYDHDFIIQLPDLQFSLTKKGRQFMEANKPIDRPVTKGL